jgi:hypothetical protein
MRLTICSILTGLLVAAASACVVSSDDGGVVDTGSTMTVSNRSSYILTEVHLAPDGSTTWGPDLLSEDLRPGEDLVVTDIRCGNYDVLVVDDTGSPCTLTNVSLCVSSDSWIVDNTTLDTCAFNPRQAPGSTQAPANDATATSTATATPH